MGIGGMGLSAVSSRPAAGSDNGDSDRAHCGQSEGQTQSHQQELATDELQAYAMAEAGRRSRKWLSHGHSYSDAGSVSAQIQRQSRWQDGRAEKPPRGKRKSEVIRAIGISGFGPLLLCMLGAHGQRLQR